MRMKRYYQNADADNVPDYAQDDGPLSATQLAALRKDVHAHLPRGMSLSRETLFKGGEGVPRLGERSMENNGSP